MTSNDNLNQFNDDEDRRRMLNAPAEQNKDSETPNFHMKKVTGSDIHLHANTCKNMTFSPNVTLTVTFLSSAPQKYLEITEVFLPDKSTLIGRLTEVSVSVPEPPEESGHLWSLYVS